MHILIIWFEELQTCWTFFFLSGKSSGPWFHYQARQRRAAQDAWWWDESHLAGVEIRGKSYTETSKKHIAITGDVLVDQLHVFVSPSYIPYPVMEHNEAPNNSPFWMEIHDESSLYGVCDDTTVYIGL